MGEELRNGSKKNPIYTLPFLGRGKVNESVHSNFKIPTYGLGVHAPSPHYGHCIKGLNQFDMSVLYKMTCVDEQFKCKS